MKLNQTRKWRNNIYLARKTQTRHGGLHGIASYLTMGDLRKFLTSHKYGPYRKSAKKPMIQTKATL